MHYAFNYSFGATRQLIEFISVFTLTRQLWAEAIAKQASAYIGYDKAAHRIIRYNLARIMWSNNRCEEGAQLAEACALEYFDELRLDPAELFLTPPEKIIDLVRQPTNFDDIKHLADALDLLAACRRSLRLPVLLAALHASKLYAVARALGSVIRVGLEAAQDFADGLHNGTPDVRGALHIIEDLVLPYIKQERLLGHALRVRNFYADLLDAFGRHDDAERERAAIAPYMAK